MRQHPILTPSLKSYVITFLIGVVLGAIGHSKLTPVPQINIKVDEGKAGAPPRHNSVGVRLSGPATPAAPLVLTDEYGLLEQVRARKATVRISHNNKTGSGVIVGHDETKQLAAVLTAHHVVEGVGDSLRVELWPYAGTSVPGSVAATVPENDLALVLIAVQDVPAALPMFPHERGPGAGDPLLSVGCSRGEDPTVIRLNLTGTTRLTGFRGTFWKVDDAGVPGRSGGPLIYRQWVIGVCYGSDYARNEGYFACLPEIHALLRQEAPWVLEEKSVRRSVYRLVAVERR